MKAEVSDKIVRLQVVPKQTIRDTLRVENLDGEEICIPAYPFQQTQEYMNRLPKVLPCYVAEDGTVEQAVAELLKECYGRKKKATFVVAEKDGDKYQVQDLFGFTHPYETYEDLELYQEVILRIQGIERRPDNHAWLNLISDDVIEITEHFQLAMGFQQADKKSLRTVSDDTFRLPYKENRKVEFKASFVYTQDGDLDIDSQMMEIMQAIAAFMNADGGDLYIGVRDDGSIRGIDDDLNYLYGYSMDKNFYKASIDGLKNKIYSSAKYHLGDISQKYIYSIDDKKNPDPDTDATFVKVKVLSANEIIWYSYNHREENNELYVRGDGYVQKYQPGPNMISYITKRVNDLRRRASRRR